MGKTYKREPKESRKQEKVEAASAKKGKGKY